MNSPGAQRQEIFAVAAGFGDRLVLARITDIEIGERHRPAARRPRDVDLGIERQQRRRQVAAEGGEADAAAFRRDVADVAGGFQAMMIGVAPPFALIVENAARIEREIAADRAHVAVGRAGNMRRGLRHDRIMLRHIGMRGDFGQRGRGADLEPMRVGLDAAQLGDAVDVDQHRRGDDAAPDVHHEIGAAADQPAVAMRGARGDQFTKRPRPDQVELRQRVHYAPPFCLRVALRSRALFQRRKNAIRRHRQIVEAQARRRRRWRW